VLHAGRDQLFLLLPSTPPGFPAVFCLLIESADGVASLIDKAVGVSGCGSITGFGMVFVQPRPLEPFACADKL
jgi:hypothetical protein